MGQKVNPNGFRTGIIKEWKFCWFDKKDSYSDLVCISNKVKYFLEKFYSKKNITDIRMEFNFNVLVVFITCQNIGGIIGEKRGKINEITSKLEKICKCQIQINVDKERQGSLSASALVSNIANQINARIPYKRAISQAIDTGINLRYLGVKVVIKGRLGGSEQARSEKFTKGKIPAHTLRSDIDYHYSCVDTIYGTLGVKMWIYKGEVYKKPSILLNARVRNTEREKTKTSEKFNRYATAK